MKQTIRKGVFETNSSSTHAICVAKTGTFEEIPNKIEIDLNDYEFGWEFAGYFTAEEKLAYLLFGILHYKYSILINGRFEENPNHIKEVTNKFEKLGKLLKKIGVETLYVNGIYFYVGKYGFNINTNGYVDHANELEDFVDEMLSSEELLKEYLFNPRSYIATGNDNDDRDVDISEDYPHETYYKGN